jgi:hypothetical protein
MEQIALERVWKCRAKRLGISVEEYRSTKGKHRRGHGRIVVEILPEPKESVTKQDIQRKCRYGISKSEFQVLLEKQDGKCAICRKDLDLSMTRGSCVDHNHTTNRVRGILCFKCNVLVGFLETGNYKRALDYISSSG